MANSVQQLSRYTTHALLETKRAHFALVANKCVAVDAAFDANGATVRPVAALADKICGVVDQSCNDGQLVTVIRGNAIVPLICVDAAVGIGIPVYNDVGGKVSLTQGTGATLIGVTDGITTAANQLVPVKLVAF